MKWAGNRYSNYLMVRCENKLGKLHPQCTRQFEEFGIRDAANLGLDFGDAVLGDNPIQGERNTR